MKRKKNGFTLVEVIATVTILGILSVIGIISVTGIIDRGKEEHYNTLEENTALAAESYVQTNRDKLPKDVGETKKIPVKDLVEYNYIEPIKDYQDKQCDLDKSYVQVYKYSKTGYSYITYLECPNYSNYENNKNIKPIIKITMTEDSNTVKNTQAIIKMTDEHKLLSYTITIYKYDEEVYTTGNIEANYETKITKKIDIDKYTPGEIKVVATATNIYGQRTTEVLTKTYKDKKGPECIIAEEDKTRTDSDWINGERKITVGCNDGEEGSGCAREEFTKTFKSDAKQGTITIEDKAGNKTECIVDVYIDKTAPKKCTIQKNGTIGNNDWYITNVDLTLTSKDEMSGIAKTSLQTTNTLIEYNNLTTSNQPEHPGITWYGYVEDYAGNKTECNSGEFKVDTTPPTSPTGGEINISGSNKNAELKTVENSYDETSKVKEYRYLVIKNDSNPPKNTDNRFTTSIKFTRSCGTTYYAYAIAIDYAGNISSVYQIGIEEDKEDKYSEWTACTKKCGGGTQTRTNSCSLVTKNLNQTCEEQECCSKVIYEDGNSCSAECGNGTYNQIAYSAYDGSRCKSQDKASGGSSCFLKSCCTESTTYGDYGSCECTGGGTCTKTRTYTKVTCNNGVATTTTGKESNTCSAPQHTHVYKARGSRLRNTSFTWTCTRGHSHTTAYYIYCQTCGQRPTSGATLVCPTNPYGPDQGWTIISD